MQGLCVEWYCVPKRLSPPKYFVHTRNLRQQAWAWPRLKQRIKILDLNPFGTGTLGRVSGIRGSGRPQKTSTLSHQRLCWPGLLFRASRDVTHTERSRQCRHRKETPTKDTGQRKRKAISPRRAHVPPSLLRKQIPCQEKGLAPLMIPLLVSFQMSGK